MRESSLERAAAGRGFVVGRPGRGRHLTAVVVATLLVGLAAACVPPEPPPDPYAPRVFLGEGEIVVEWDAPSEDPAVAYDVMVDDGSGWVQLVTTPDTTTTFTDVIGPSSYRFRVRTAASGGAPSGEWSKPVTGYYVEPLLPVVRIETEDHAPILDKENYVPGTVEIDPNGTDFEPYSGTIGIRGRGNSTWAMEKKPYKMKLDSKSEIMGMAAERDWALLANAFDPSQLRSYVAGQASEATDLPYTPTYRHVEVILNGRYDGVYQLTQHNEVGPDRVDITEMEPEDNFGLEVTGGYRLEIDERLEENDEPGFRTAVKKVPVVVKDPEPMTPQQRNYIRTLVQAFENSLVGPNFKDPVNGYRKYLDIGSFVDLYLVNELTRNHDYFFSSTFFTKERGEDKFEFGPMWDFDLSMGTVRRDIDAPPEGWRARTRGVWTIRLFEDPAFVREVADRWDELEPAFRQLPDQIEQLGPELRPAIANDEVRWNYSLHTTDQPEFLSDWLSTRIDWMDSQFDAVE